MPTRPTPRDTPEIGMILRWNGLLACSFLLFLFLSLTRYTRIYTYTHTRTHTYTHIYDGDSLARWLVSAQLRDTQCVRLASNGGSPPQLNSRVFLCPRIFTAAPPPCPQCRPWSHRLRLSHPSLRLSLSFFFSFSLSLLLSVSRPRCTHKLAL